jgi:hypothetical protein
MNNFGTVHGNSSISETTNKEGKYTKFRAKNEYIGGRILCEDAFLKTSHIQK